MSIEEKVAEFPEDRAICTQCEECANLFRPPFGVCPYNEAMTEAMKHIGVIMDETQAADRKNADGTDKPTKVNLSITKGGWKCKYYEKVKGPELLLLPAPEENIHRVRRLKFELKSPLVIE